MKATNSPFDTINVSDSLERMKAILDAPDGAYEERDSIPSPEALTFENGFYVKCAALFIDIRGSSGLPDQHTRPVLGKLYRAYISECVAVLNSDPNCREVSIKGDCVNAILDTPFQPNVNTAFETAAKLNSLVMILNWQLEGKGYTPIQCGIGLAYGRALMLKAGFKGSAINDIVWMGDVVNEASKLCGKGNKDGNAPVQVSGVVHNNLNETYRGFLQMRFDLEPVGFRYEGHAVNVAMDKWFTEQKEKERRFNTLADFFRESGLFQPAPKPTLRGLFALPPVRPENTLLGLAGLFDPTKR